MSVVWATKVRAAAVAGRIGFDGGHLQGVWRRLQRGPSP